MSSPIWGVYEMCTTRAPCMQFVLRHSGTAVTAGNCLLREVGPGVDTLTP